MNRSPAEIRDRWLNYGRRYAVHPTLWDSSLAFASGPLSPEAGTLHDYSGRTSGATWSVGAGDVPKYAQGSVRGESFWAGRYDGSNDHALLYPSVVGPTGSAKRSIAFWFKLSTAPVNFKEMLCWGYNNYPTARWSPWLQTGKIGIESAGSGVLADWVHDTDWHSFVATLEGPTSDSTRLFLDGAELSCTYPAATTYNTTGITAIGALYAAAAAGIYSFPGDIASVVAYSRPLVKTEITTLARHPLEAFRVEVPKYWSFATPGGTHLWPWQIRHSRRVRGHR